MSITAIIQKNPFILAPLAGYTNLAFRLLCREYGAGLCFSEMISSHGLAFNQKKTLQMIQTVAEERPVAFQLFGSNPDIMGEAARILSDRQIDLIDINMGCPVKKVIKNGSGSALMQEPDLAKRIIKKVCEQSKIPVSVKMRSGWTQETINAVDISKMAEDAGSALITIHGRTQSQGFGGKADWDIIAKVKQAVTIPVIGNGDIMTYQDGLRMMEKTDCDGVMIGRAAMDNPWVFQPQPPPSTLMPRLFCIERHLELISKYHLADTILARTKNHTGRYLKGIQGGAAIRRQIYETKSFTELRELNNYLIQSTDKEI